MDVNREAISFAAFSLAKILAAELLRKGILDHQEFLSAISDEVRATARDCDRDECRHRGVADGLSRRDRSGRRVVAG